MAVERDDVTGIDTTGHEWDGIKELDAEPPRWMLTCYAVAILWSIGYWVLMPTWPSLSGFTAGLLGYSQRVRLAENIATATAAKSAWTDKIKTQALADIAADQKLKTIAISGGRAAFGDNCVVCHGLDAGGAPGFPALTDGAWLWGGSLTAIHETIRVGINSSHDDSRVSAMPAFGAEEILTRKNVDDVTEHVLSLSGRGAEPQAAQRGAAVYKENCVDCHGANARGKTEVGAPDLTDSLWIYGGTREALWQSIHGGRKGVMPNWDRRLDAATIKQIALYVHAVANGSAR